MNKEDIENLVNTDFNKMEIIINRIYKEDYVRKLEQENQLLHSKINKAIRYIKKNKHYIDIEDMNVYLYEDDIKKVLEILKR